MDFCGFSIPLHAPIVHSVQHLSLWCWRLLHRGEARYCLALDCLKSTGLHRVINLLVNHGRHAASAIGLAGNKGVGTHPKVQNNFQLSCSMRWLARLLVRWHCAINASSVISQNPAKNKRASLVVSAVVVGKIIESTWVLG